MSTKFVVVKERPVELPKGTYVIEFPNFLDEIWANRGRQPRGNTTANTHLRYIVGTIGEKYDPELTAYTVKPHLYEGRTFNNDQELSKIVVEMLQAQYPKVFEKYLEHQIRNRPANTKLIYYVGNFIGTGPFFANGVDNIDEKEVDVYLGLKPKNVVGKPAITDEEANASK